MMVVVVIFFNSSMWNNFWYGTILKKPVPTYTPKQRAEVQDTAQAQQLAPTAQQIGESGGEPPGGQQLSAVSGSETDSAYTHPDSIGIEAAQLVEDTIIVETNRVIAALSTKGARIISLKMKHYPYTSGPLKDELIDILPRGSVGGAQLKINDESFDEEFFTVINGNNSADGTDEPFPRHITVAAPDGYQLAFEAKSSAGHPIQKIFTFADDTYRIGYTVRGNLAGRKVTTGWVGGIEEPEGAQDLPFGQMMDRRRAHYSNGKTADHLEMTKKGAEEPSGMFRWIGMSSKYFFIALVAEELSDADLRIEGRLAGRGSNAKEQVIDYSVYYQIQAEGNEINDWIYAGPNGIKELAQHGLKFEKALFPVLSWARHIFWADAWFPPLAEIVLWTLVFFYGIAKDYGVAIFLLTLLCKLITFPLTQSSAKSMLQIRELQPKLMKLREKHKGNPQKLNEEMMALYKAEGVNPFNPGCLPMFLQMPIFIALFIVLRKAIELRSTSSFLLPWVGDLSQPEALFYLPFTLPLYGANVALMPIIMAALTFFQQKATITDPNQKAIIYIMPPIMLVLFNSFPAGVVFYWTVSSALSLVQQKWLAPKVRKPAGAALAVAGGGTVPSSGAAQSYQQPQRHKAPMKNRSGGGGGKRPKK